MQHESNGNASTHVRPKAHLVGVHSYRGGSGKTTLAANLAVRAARSGARVAVLDGDLQAPALHVAFGVGPKRILHSVSEFVQGQCELHEVPIDLSGELAVEEPGRLFFLPSSTDLPVITSILFDGYDVARLNEELWRLAQALELDYLILDTHLGINRESLLSMAVCDTVFVLCRPYGQDRDGAALIAQMARKVGAPACWLVPSMVERGGDADELGAKLEQELGAPVAGILPWCADFPELASRGAFTAQHEAHPYAAGIERVFERLSAAGPRAPRQDQAKDPQASGNTKCGCAQEG
jgi:MinD-like ATPase involved in chromosome partitioning or flagellar assembly